ncbi:uncharacterized protein LOC119430979 isoform X2 [Dermacentor silvarum]|uniref:uncharacterized protein LOC119430979 isoform X2 n=1 Tax=Dermacentor silvarum TaxID=543639 RepID=UPI002100D4C9|nr:uncharacterized protein LOC119430979 isoform X2 [Dermacentor silvarum]
MLNFKTKYSGIRQSQCRGDLLLPSMHEGEPPTLDWPLDESPRKELSVSLQSMANLEKSFTKERPRSAASSVGESVCPVCSREFKMRCHMVVHLRSAHGVDPATFLDMPQSRNRQGLQKGRAKHTTSRVKAVHKRHRELARKAAAERAAQHQLPKAAAAVATVGTVSKASTPKAKKPKPGGSAQQPSSSQQVTGTTSSVGLSPHSRSTGASKPVDPTKEASLEVA